MKNVFEQEKRFDEQSISIAKNYEQPEITISGAGCFTRFHTISRYT